MIAISALLIHDIYLLLEFNAFLPTGYLFEFQADGSIVQVSPHQQRLLSQSWDEQSGSDVESSAPRSNLGITRSREFLNAMHEEIEDLSGTVVKLTSEPSFHGTFSQVFKGKCNGSQVAWDYCI
jgi:histone deacetylase complex regulatory component SIN3